LKQKAIIIIIIIIIIEKIQRLKSEEIKTKNLKEVDVRIVDFFETFVQQNCVVALQSHGQQWILLALLFLKYRL